MAGDVVGGAIGAVGIAGLRTHVDRQCEQPVHAPHVRTFGLTEADLAEIEQGNLQLDIEAAQTNAFVGPFFQLVGITHLEKIDEARCFGEAVGFRQDVKLDPPDLQIHAPANRFHLDSGQGLKTVRKRR